MTSVRIDRPEPVEMVDAAEVNALIAATDDRLADLERRAQAASALAERAAERARAEGVDEAAATWAMVRLQRFLDGLIAEAERDVDAMLAAARQGAARIDEARADATRAAFHGADDHRPARPARDGAPWPGPSPVFSAPEVDPPPAPSPATPPVVEPPPAFEAPAVVAAPTRAVDPPSVVTSPAVSTPHADTGAPASEPRVAAEELRWAPAHTPPAPDAPTRNGSVAATALAGSGELAAATPPAAVPEAQPEPGPAAPPSVPVAAPAPSAATSAAPATVAHAAAAARVPALGGARGARRDPRAGVHPVATELTRSAPRARRSSPPRHVPFAILRVGCPVAATLRSLPFRTFAQRRGGFGSGADMVRVLVVEQGESPPRRHRVGARRLLGRHGRSSP